MFLASLCRSFTDPSNIAFDYLYREELSKQKLEYADAVLRLEGEKKILEEKSEAISKALTEVNERVFFKIGMKRSSCRQSKLLT